MCFFFQSIFARLCLLWSTPRGRSDQIPLLKCQSYIIWISFSSLVMWRPLFTHQPGQTLTSHSYSIPQQKSAAFLLNSLVLPFCTWGLPEWWSTEVFVLEAGALAAYTIKVFWKSLRLNCLVVCFLSSSLLLRWLSGSGLTSIADTCVVSSSPHPLFLFDLFMKVSLLISCTVLIKGFYWLKNHYEPMNPALIYQSTAEMSVWHKMQSVSSAGFNYFGFFFFFDPQF